MLGLAPERGRSGSGRHALRRLLVAAALVLAAGLILAASAAARIVRVEDGHYLPDGRNLTVGSMQRSPTEMPVPAAFLQSPTGALERVIDFPNADAGILLDGSVVNGTAYALQDVYTGFRVIAFDPSTEEVLCQGPVFDGDGRAIAVVDIHIYVVGADDVDDEKAIWQLDTEDCDLDPDPDAGDPFAGDAQVTQDPSTGSDVFTDVETDGDELFLAGEENAKDVIELDIYDLDGNLVGGFAFDPGDPDAVNVFDLVLAPGADGDMDPDDVMYAFGGFGFQGFVGARERDGGIPPLCPSPLPDSDGFLPWEIVPGADNIDLVTGAVQYPGMGWAVAGNSLSFGGDFRAFINFYDPSFCDATPGWVGLFPDFRTSFVSGLERPSSSTVFAFGERSQDPNVETLGFKTQRTLPSLGMGPYGTAVINPFVAPGDPGNPGNPGNPGDPGSPGLPGDFDLNGAVDAADYVVWRNGVLSENGLTVTMQTPNGVRSGSVTGLYSEWRANFGRRSGSQRASVAQRRKPKLFARNRTVLRGNDSKRIRVRLTKAGRRLVRGYARKRLRGTLTLRVTYRPEPGAAAQRRTFKQKVTLRVKRKRR